MRDVDPRAGELESVMTPNQIAFIATVRMTEASPSELIPDDISASDIISYGKAISRFHDYSRKAMQRAKLFLGRVLVVYKNRPELVAMMMGEYANFDDWMRHGVPQAYSVSGSEAYDCLRIAEELPDMSVIEMEQLGISKLKAVSTAIRRTTSTDMPVERREEVAREWIATGHEQSYQKLKQMLAVKGIISPEEFDAPSTISFIVSRAAKDDWEKFSSDPAVQEYCGTKDPGQIFIRQFQEARGEWLAQIQHAMTGAVPDE